MHPLENLKANVNDLESQRDAFRVVLEDHLDEFKKRNLRAMDIADHAAVRCRGDFYALLTEHDIEQDLFWLTMRLNEYRSPDEFNGDRTAFVLVDRNLYDELLGKFKSREITV